MENQIAEMRQSFFDEGIFDNQFSMLEDLEDVDNPNFVEEVINIYFRDSTELIASVEQTMKQNHVDSTKLDKSLHQLKGSSGSIGAIKVRDEVSRTRTLCQEGNLEGAKAAFQEVKAEHNALRAKLEAYFQMKRTMGPAEPATPSN